MGYEPIARLGRGGMGVVDLARDQDGKQVALKRLTLHGSASEVLRSRQRLLREAEVLRRLHHPNVVGLIDVIEEGDDVVLVMPYMAGGNLSERVAQHGPAPPDEIDKLAQRLLGALAEAHALGIIHRDVKPANVLYDDQAEPHLADFGLAHTWDQTHGLTVAGMVVGTPGFMPPEQARDEPLTPASDIFAVGATLLFAATGGGPFGSGDPALLMVRAAAGKVEKVPKTLPKPLRKRLQRMLDPKPERRPTAAALLAEYAAERGSSWRLPAVHPNGPSRGMALAVGVGCVALVAGVVLVSGRDGGGDTDALGEAAPGVVEGTQPGSGGGGDGEPADPDQHVGAPGDEPDDPDDPGYLPDQPDGATPLLDRLDAMIDPATPADVYPLPLGDALDTTCPRAIEVSLRLTSPEPAQLRLAVMSGDTVLGEDVAQAGYQAVVVFGPEVLCQDKSPVVVTVESLQPLLEPVPYALERRDTE
ncbi:MAG TPA: serine/threonine-protein kinase [Acidimicrobiales bacterium]